MKQPPDLEPIKFEFSTINPVYDADEIPFYIHGTAVARIKDDPNSIKKAQEHLTGLEESEVRDITRDILISCVQKVLGTEKVSTLLEDWTENLEHLADRIRFATLAVTVKMGIEIEAVEIHSAREKIGYLEQVRKREKAKTRLYKTLTRLGK